MYFKIFTHNALVQSFWNYPTRMSLDKTNNNNLKNYNSNGVLCDITELKRLMNCTNLLSSVGVLHCIFLQHAQSLLKLNTMCFPATEELSLRWCAAVHVHGSYSSLPKPGTLPTIPPGKITPFGHIHIGRHVFI